MCYFFVTFTWYGSKITNVWQEIFTPMTLAFSCEAVHEKLRKSVNICKSYSKKISGTFFLDTVYTCVIYCWFNKRLRLFMIVKTSKCRKFE